MAKNNPFAASASTGKIFQTKIPSIYDFTVEELERGAETIGKSRRFLSALHDEIYGEETVDHSADIVNGVQFKQWAYEDFDFAADIFVSLKRNKNLFLALLQQDPPD